MTGGDDNNELMRVAILSVLQSLRATSFSGRASVSLTVHKRMLNPVNVFLTVLSCQEVEFLEFLPVMQYLQAQERSIDMATCTSSRLCSYVVQARKQYLPRLNDPAWDGRV